MLKEFKEFAVKGNMVDMAVGIIIGAAFGTVVKSVVDDILMPIIAAVTGSPDFSNLFVLLKAPADVTGVNMESIEAVRAAGGVALGYGLFINALIAFLIVAWVLFIVVKGMNRLQREKEAEVAEEAPAEPELSTQEKLLLEIRDLLKTQAAGA
jgi:large conductance mechanosensitive channel